MNEVSINNLDTLSDMSTQNSELALERAHLKSVYKTLLEIRDILQEEIETNHHGAKQDLINLSEEVRLNFGAADETMETLAAIETLNSVIDTYNEYHDISVEKLSRVMLLLEKPYFAKVSLQMKEGEKPRDVYIAVCGMTDKNVQPIVVDWRSPIAQTYYNQENGATSYEVNGKRRSVTLLGRRQFDIYKDQLHSYFDTSVAIEDSLLLEALKRTHSQKLQAITATIQKEQNSIIREKDVPVMLVSGIAGSGKTSVMLQRIAFLLYNKRSNLKPSDIYVFTPSDVFRRYIDTVLPQLGEENPHIFTWRSFLKEINLGERGDGSKLDPSRLFELEDKIADFEPEDADFKALSLYETTLVSTKQIQKAYEKYSRFPAGPRRSILTAELLHTALNRAIGRMAGQEKWQEELLSLDSEDQLNIFEHSIDPSSEEQTKELTKKYLEYKFSAAHQMIDHLCWIKLDRIGLRMLHSQTLSAAEHLWLRMLFSGQGAKNARYVIIDEVQDYSKSQLMVLARYFKGAHFMLFGDPNQAISKYSVAWNEIPEVFCGAGEIKKSHLQTSYRSSPEITALFAGLLSQEEQAKLHSVQKAGVAAQIEELTDENYIQRLQEVVSDAKKEEGTKAIIAFDQRRVHWLSRQLNFVCVVQDDSSISLNDVALIELKLAKGLEFDHVIIPDAQEDVYSDTALCKRCLYTAISRATKKISILSQGKMTPLLADRQPQHRS